MANFEDNVRASFMVAKREIAGLKAMVSRLKADIHELSEMNGKLIGSLSRVPGGVKKVSRFIAGKSTDLLHDQGCPFAKRMLPKNTLVFRSKRVALNRGYRLCECLKKYRKD
ncbi:hypothetical protein HYU11_02685 [Candidatus Woesearchaeota archaeon]|nr:hypothetical protein [Candidatus Woesearchaeota archaeon]